MTDDLMTLRDAAKASPVEHELVCPNGHEVELNGVPDRGPLLWCEECLSAFDVRALVRSGRTRPQQFTSFPKPEAFR